MQKQEDFDIFWTSKLIASIGARYFGLGKGLLDKFSAMWNSDVSIASAKHKVFKLTQKYFCNELINSIQHNNFIIEITLG